MPRSTASTTGGERRRDLRRVRACDRDRATHGADPTDGRPQAVAVRDPVMIAMGAAFATDLVGPPVTVGWAQRVHARGRGVAARCHAILAPARPACPPGSMEECRRRRSSSGQATRSTSSSRSTPGVSRCRTPPRVAKSLRRSAVSQMCRFLPPACCAASKAGGQPEPSAPAAQSCRVGRQVFQQSTTSAATRSWYWNFGWKLRFRSDGMSRLTQRSEPSSVQRPWL